jgi:hypothetical protein
VTAPLLSTADYAPAAAGAKQPTVKVPPCEGCGALPHGGTTGEANCLRAALRASRAECARLRARLPLEAA